MQPSRRRFLLTLTTLAAVSAVAAVVGARPFYHWFRDRVVYRLPADSHLRKLRPDVLDTLMTAAEDLIGQPIEPSHYRELFYWYAGNVPGYAALYEGIVDMLDRTALSESGLSFVRCDSKDRNALLKHILAFRGARLAKLWVVLADRDRLLLERYVADPVLRLFAQTDALILLGYKTWPGTPQGFDEYRKPIASQELPAAAALLYQRRPA